MFRKADHSASHTHSLENQVCLWLISLHRAVILHAWETDGEATSAPGAGVPVVPQRSRVFGLPMEAMTGAPVRKFWFGRNNNRLLFHTIMVNDSVKLPVAELNSERKYYLISVTIKFTHARQKMKQLKLFSRRTAQTADNSDWRWVGDGQSAVALPASRVIVR